ncbi:MAG: nucleotidyltransferase family protein [Lachnospiraceae bacterium]|nr:nucleotidyltransferase family protein [Lachnospiraceae bacterium]
MSETNKPVKNSVGCVIMAAGNSERFGSNKLLSLFEGKTLIKHTFDAVPSDSLSSVIVVTQYDEILSLAASYSFQSIINDRPEDGISRTIRIGTEALKDSCDAILYMVSDQPRLRKESIEGLISFFREHPGKIAAASYNGKRGNPCIFPKKFFPSLLKLSGDTGGSSVIRSNPDELLLYEVGPGELSDIDTKSDIVS